MVLPPGAVRELLAWLEGFLERVKKGGWSREAELELLDHGFRLLDDRSALELLTFLPVGVAARHAGILDAFRVGGVAGYLAVAVIEGGALYRVCLVLAFYEDGVYRGTAVYCRDVAA